MNRFRQAQILWSWALLATLVLTGCNQKPQSGPTAARAKNGKSSNLPPTPNVVTSDSSKSIAHPPTDKTSLPAVRGHGGPGAGAAPPSPQVAIPAGVGAFVDLNYAGARNPTTYGTGSSWFSGPPSEFSGFFRTVNNGGQYTHLLLAYDTWAPVANNSFDGVDNNGNGVIDEPDELIAEMWSNSNPTGQFIAPPYPFPIRGLQATLRVYDPDSKQVRQMKASASFTSD